MFPGLNPKKMEAMMKQMGINQEEIDAVRVIIEKEDGKIIIENPSVIKIDIQGQENFQVSGDVKEYEEESGKDKFEEDVKILMEKCNCLEEEARNALEKADGDLTEAIMELS
ncbi:MAG: nascent polypeptide-associated complex protein [Nanoarchaeota archaeon]